MQKIAGGPTLAISLVTLEAAETRSAGFSIAGDESICQSACLGGGKKRGDAISAMSVAGRPVVRLSVVAGKAKNVG